MAKELQQTNGSVKFYGHVVGLQNENTFREGVTKNGDGVPYRSASLAIKTSPNNVVYNNDVFGQESETVKIFSNKGGEKQKQEIPFKDRLNLPDGFIPSGLSTVRTAFEKNSKGGYDQKVHFNYDGVEVIKKSLKDGDSVYVNAEFSPNTFTSNGETRTTVKYRVKSIGLMKTPVDFEVDNFKEVASFEQEFVAIDTNIDKEAKKLYVTGRIIHFNKSWDDITFVIDGSRYEKLVANFIKKVKFGDLLKVEGVIRNGTVLEEVKVVDNEIDWGGETPEGQGQKFNRNKISEIQITNVKEHKAKVYKEEDFITQDPFENVNKGSVSESSGDSFASDDENEDPFA